MKKCLTVISFILSLSFSAMAESPCRTKVIGHYKALYHRTYKAASNTFLNNFVGRKNMFAHTWGHPDVAFPGYSIVGENYIAQAITQKSGRDAKEVLETYYALLDSDELCSTLGDDYTHPRKIKKLLLEKLKND